MRLPRKKHSQTKEALLSGYTTSSLRQMVREQLGKELEQIAGGENLTDIVFNLIGWAERTGNVQRLIKAAYAGNKTNQLLKKLHKDAEEWFRRTSSVETSPYRANDSGVKRDRREQHTRSTTTKRSASQTAEAPDSTRETGTGDGAFAGQTPPTEQSERAYSQSFVDPTPRSKQNRTQPVSGAPKRILFLDDSADWRKQLSSILLEEGYDVEIAATEDDAWNRITNVPFDLIILDVRLDETDENNIDGAHLAMRIKEIRPEMPVILFTGYVRSIPTHILLQMPRHGVQVCDKVDFQSGGKADILYQIELYFPRTESRKHELHNRIQSSYRLALDQFQRHTTEHGPDEQGQFSEDKIMDIIRMIDEWVEQYQQRVEGTANLAELKSIEQELETIAHTWSTNAIVELYRQPARRI